MKDRYNVCEIIRAWALFHQIQQVTSNLWVNERSSINSIRYLWGWEVNELFGRELSKL